MNKFRHVLSLLLLCSFLSLTQAPNLDLSKMQADFDFLIQHINQFAVHKDLNQQRLGINYEAEFEELRKELNINTTPCDFQSILNRATFLVQDGHCCFMPSDYLETYGKYQVKLNFPDDATYSEVKAFENACHKEERRLNLPIHYQKGAYYFYTDFIYQKDTVWAGTKITAYQQQKVAKVIKANYDKIFMLRWDEELQQAYHPSFYQYLDLQFELQLEKEKQFSLQFDQQDSIQYLEQMFLIPGYGSQKEAQIQYWEKENLLYIGLPMMDMGFADKIVSQLDSITEQHPSFNKIVFDVRGNPGGTDLAWRKVIKRLIKDPIPFTADLRFKYNEAVVEKYGNKKSKAIGISLLDEKKYWIKENSIKSIKPDRKSIRHKGKIYVIQDEFIYSSASNLSNFCLNAEQLVSVGKATDLVGGLQTDPLFIRLPHSKLVFRVEPMLDFSNVKQLEDFAHNKVEVPIDYSVEDLKKRLTYSGYIYEEGFLRNHDPFIRYVLRN